MSSISKAPSRATKEGWLVYLSLDKKGRSEVKKTVHTWMKNSINVVGSFSRNTVVV